MPELCKPNSRKVQYCECLTASFRAWKCLFLIGFAYWWSQEAIGMVKGSWNCLEQWIRLTTFLYFLQVCSDLMRLSLAFFWVCKYSLCTEEWIRVANMITIFLRHCFWFGFDTLENLAKHIANSISLCTPSLYTNSISC